MSQRRGKEVLPQQKLNFEASEESRQRRGYLVVPKLLAFFSAFSGVGWNRFGVFLLLDAGLTPAQVGFMKTLGFFGKLVALPLWGVIADSYSLFGSLVVS